MRLAGEQLGGALADALGPIAAQEAAMVEEKAQQVQVVVANVATQEEVISQAAVEILNDGTGSRRLGHDLLDGGFEIVQPMAKLMVQRGAALSMRGVMLIDALQFTDGVHPKRRHVEAHGQVVQLLIQHAGESQQLIALVFERPSHRADAMRA